LADAALFAALVTKYANPAWRSYALWCLSAVVVAYLVYEAHSAVRLIRISRHGGARRGASKQPTALVLMNEDAEKVRHWDLRNRVGLVVGRGENGADADVDLSGTEYFSLISDCHAVLNYTDKGWYLADAGSKNGTAIARNGSPQKLNLAPHEPVPIRVGDVIYIAGETALAVR
jgi:hypothetical protein